MFQDYTKSVLNNALYEEIERVEWYLEKLTNDLKVASATDEIDLPAMIQRDIEANIADLKELNESLVLLNSKQFQEL